MDLFYVILPKMERLIVLDTETTGIETISEGHRIIEVGAVEILDREITEVPSFKNIFNQTEKSVSLLTFMVLRINF